MGKKSGGDTAPVTQKIDPFAQESANIARELFKESTPLRKLGVSQLTSQIGDEGSIPNSSDIQAQIQQFVPQGLTLDPNQFQLSQLGQLSAPQVGNVQQLGNLNLQGVLERAAQLEVDQNFNRNFGSLKAAQEEQFNRARQNVLSSGGTGGALAGGLTQLESDRAIGLSQLLAQLGQQQSQARGVAINQALGIGGEDLLRQERGLERQLGATQVDIERQLGIDQANLQRALDIQAANQATNLGIAGTNLERGVGLAGAQTDINQRNIDRALAVGSGGAINALQGFGIGGNLAASAAATQAALQNAQANRSAAAKGSKGQAIGQLGSAAILRGGGGCWVAREVYGIQNPMWVRFWQWKENYSYEWFKDFYDKNGEQFALWLHDKPRIKGIVRWLMNRAVGVI